MSDKDEYSKKTVALVDMSWLSIAMKSYRNIDFSQLTAFLFGQAIDVEIRSYQLENHSNRLSEDIRRMGREIIVKQGHRADNLIRNDIKMLMNLYEKFIVIGPLNDLSLITELKHYKKKEFIFYNFGETVNMPEGVNFTAINLRQELPKLLVLPKPKITGVYKPVDDEESELELRQPLPGKRVVFIDGPNLVNMEILKDIALDFAGIKVLLSEDAVNVELRYYYQPHHEGADLGFLAYIKKMGYKCFPPKEGDSDVDSAIQDDIQRFSHGHLADTIVLVSGDHGYSELLYEAKIKFGIEVIVFSCEENLHQPYKRYFDKIINPADFIDQIKHENRTREKKEWRQTIAELAQVSEDEIDVDAKPTEPDSSVEDLTAAKITVDYTESEDLTPGAKACLNDMLRAMEILAQNSHISDATIHCTTSAKEISLELKSKQKLPETALPITTN